MRGNITFQDIATRKADFIGHTGHVTVGLGEKVYFSDTIGNIEIRSNCIIISFQGNNPELVLPVEEVSVIYLTARGFQIRSKIYSCSCNLN